MTANSLAELTYDNSFVQALPVDPEEDNFRRQVAGAVWSRVRPTPVAKPRVLAASREVAALLGLSEAALGTDAFAEVMGGNGVAEGMQTYATVYGGHQFGSWARQLGDGRAIGLGEVLTPGGDRWELQLKGAGPTPYSRTADGRAVLRSSIREFLCSEAMHHLGVPTTRALSLVTTGEAVVRDMFYDGHPRAEPGAVVCRVAPTFLRFGHFQLPASRGDDVLLKALADYAVSTHFADLGSPGPEAYVAMLAEVARRTAVMIAHWMRVGFVHGVMNTDNMSLLGLTIDYGPYGWLDDYDPDWTPNTTDAQGRRYRFGHQPGIALWNLVRFAEALVPLVGETAPLEAALGEYGDALDAATRQQTAAKLGVRELGGEADAALLAELDVVMRSVETDMTIFYRRLAQVPVGEPARGLDDDALLAPLVDAYYAPDDLAGDVRERVVAWLRRYTARAGADGLDPDERVRVMNGANPKYVLRNYMAQVAIDEAEEHGTGGVVRELLELVRRPYDEQPDAEKWAVKRPDWARSRPGCSMLSCSS